MFMMAVGRQMTEDIGFPTNVQDPGHLVARYAFPFFLFSSCCWVSWTSRHSLTFPAQENSALLTLFLFFLCVSVSYPYFLNTLLTGPWGTRTTHQKQLGVVQRTPFKSFKSSLLILWVELKGFSLFSPEYLRTSPAGLCIGFWGAGRCGPAAQGRQSIIEVPASSGQGTARSGTHWFSVYCVPRGCWGLQGVERGGSGVSVHTFTTHQARRR